MASHRLIIEDNLDSLCFLQKVNFPYEHRISVSCDFPMPALNVHLNRNAEAFCFVRFSDACTELYI